MKIRTAFLALIIAPTLALATDSPPNNEHHAAARMARLSTLLDLDESQKTQVRTILEEQHKARKAQGEAAKAAGARVTREQREATRKETLEKLKPVSRCTGFPMPSMLPALLITIGPETFPARLRRDLAPLSCSRLET